MHNASLASPRLQRVLLFLRQRGARGATTLEIVQEANVCAVNSIVAELRECGIRVDCTMEGKGRFRYRLIEGELRQEVLFG